MRINFGSGIRSRYSDNDRYNSGLFIERSEDLPSPGDHHPSPQTMNYTYNELFSALSTAIENFIQEVKNKKSGLMTGDAWTVKDQLCHIVFWHENYAANYEALAAHCDPPLPEGMSTINMAGVLSLRKYAMTSLIIRLREANKSLYKSIVVKKVPRMTYSKGGRTYETGDFLEMITRHIATHTKQVKRASTNNA